MVSARLLLENKWDKKRAYFMAPRNSRFLLVLFMSTHTNIVKTKLAYTAILNTRQEIHIQA